MEEPPVLLDGSDLAARLDDVRQRIARAAESVGRDPAGVTLVAVSKRHPAAAVAMARSFGQRLFGESYVQEMLAKSGELAGQDIAWHFIGGLQKNKAKYLPGVTEMVHTVDNFDVARILHERSAAKGLIQDVLIQVNVAGEEQKSGVAPQELARLAKDVTGLGAVRLLGLMVMPPYDPDPEASRPHFRRLGALRIALEEGLGIGLPHLSMGMSHDLETAVAEGATLVRVGEDVFGPRPGCAMRTKP